MVTINNGPENFGNTSPPLIFRLFKCGTVRTVSITNIINQLFELFLGYLSTLCSTENAQTGWMIMNCEFTVPYFEITHLHLRKPTAYTRNCGSVPGIGRRYVFSPKCADKL